jgi:hypothetical protein
LRAIHPFQYEILISKLFEECNQPRGKSTSRTLRRKALTMQTQSTTFRAGVQWSSSAFRRHSPAGFSRMSFYVWSSQLDLHPLEIASTQQEGLGPLLA